MARAVIAFDIDGTLLDTRTSFNRVVKEISGVDDDADLERFRATGGFNDDWELARALVAWAAAGKPKIVERCDSLEEVLLWCGNDPGDLAPACQARYRGTDGSTPLWTTERVIIAGTMLDQLSEHFDVVACTGRDAWELERAEERLGYSFARATTMEQAKKPDPRALLRLLDDDDSPDVVVLIGDTHADRLTVRQARRQRPQQRFAFVHVDYDKTAAAFIDGLIAGGDLNALLQEHAEFDQ